MKMKPKHNVDFRSIFLLVFIAGGLVALFNVSRFFRAEEDDPEAYAANHQRIERMTETERERVKHRAERFFSKSEEERERIRDLHNELQHDLEAEKLKKVLTRYNDWLTSLSPSVREDLRERLRNAKTSEERILIIEDQRNEDFVKTLDGPDREFFVGVSTPEDRRKRIAEFRESSYRPSSRHGRGSFPAIDLADLAPLFKAIEGQLKLSPAEKKELESLPEPRRSYRIAGLALKEKNNNSPGQSSSGPFSDSNMRKLVEENVEDKDVKEKLIGSRFRRPWFGIGQSLFRERGKTAGKPTAQQQSDFFASLSREKRDELMQTTGLDRIKRMNQWYYKSGGEDGAEFQAYMNEWYRSWNFGGKFRSSRNGSGGSRGQRPGPPEKRRPPENGKRPEKTSPPFGKRP